MPRTKTQRKSARPSRHRKNMRLDQALLDSAKRALGTVNETEAVTLALKRVVNNGQVASGLRALGGSRLIDAKKVRSRNAE